MRCPLRSPRHGSCRSRGPSRALNRAPWRCCGFGCRGGGDAHASEPDLAEALQLRDVLLLGRDALVAVVDVRVVGEGLLEEANLALKQRFAVRAAVRRRSQRPRVRRPRRLRGCGRVAELLGVRSRAVVLVPPSLDEWLPADHFARLVIAAVEAMDLSGVLRRLSGGRAWPAGARSGDDGRVLVYAYARAQRSSRVIERGCFEDVAMR